MEDEDRAKSKADEVNTKRWESDILRRELALPFLKEAYFSDGNSQGYCSQTSKDNDDVLLCLAEELIQRLTKTIECSNLWKLLVREVTLKIKLMKELTWLR